MQVPRLKALSGRQDSVYLLPKQLDEQAVACIFLHSMRRSLSSLRKQIVQVSTLMISSVSTRGAYGDFEDCLESDCGAGVREDLVDPR